MEDFSGEQDLPNVRTIPFNNNKIKMERLDPYGFVKISYERGPVPEELSGSYTSFTEARQAAMSYLERTKKDVKEATK